MQTPGNVLSDIGEVGIGHAKVWMNLCTFP